MKTIKILMISSIEEDGNAMRAIGETIGRQVYQRETGKETSKKSPPGSEKT